ncbi:MAG: SCO family protein [Proteobacteria bacterium]|nr:SCO family protein [Pseudomonadota bacterium]
MAVFDRLQAFMEGWRFPSFMLAVLVAWPALLLGILAIPGGEGGLASFAEQFKVWCLGYDPATGTLQMAYVVMLLVNPLMLVGIVLAVWMRPLKEGWADSRGGVMRALLAGAALVLLAGVGLTLLTDSGFDPDEVLPFPADRLRTSHAVPAFDLVDQAGVPVSSTELGGGVTVLTSVYATCPHTCPIILTELKATMAELPPTVAAEVQILAITMDPANDGPEELTALAELQGLGSQYRLLSGPVEPIDELLDNLAIARQRDPDTGVINHSNQFILVGRDGRIAYRLNLGPHQRQWLISALGVLAAEERGPVG